MVTAGLKEMVGRIPGTDKVGIKVSFYPHEIECNHDDYPLTQDKEWDDAVGKHVVKLSMCGRCDRVRIEEKIT